MDAKKSLSEKELQNEREQALVAAARRALDQNNPVTALCVIEKIPRFWASNLITLLGVIGFHSNNIPLKKRATSLFFEHLKRCTNAQALTNTALWIRSPKRNRSLPDQYREAIDAQRKMLEPDWDGVWYNGGIGPKNVALAILSKQPKDVFDTDACLVAATQAGNWGPWVNQYLDLGGDRENPRYLKLFASKAIVRDRKPSGHDLAMLRKFTALGDIPEVREFLRHITPTRNSLKGVNLNYKFAECALHLYCECERLEHANEDWVHIAKSALYLDHRMVGRIAQRVLAELERDFEAQEVFEDLIQMYGKVGVTNSARSDIGSYGNSIWESLYHRFPVDANAKKILSSYSRHALDAP